MLTKIVAKQAIDVSLEKNTRQLTRSPVAQEVLLE